MTRTKDLTWDTPATGGDDLEKALPMMSGAESSDILQPDSPVTASTVEQPLPFMMAQMGAWSVAFTALVVLPLATVAFAAAPFYFAYDALRRR